MKVLGFLCFLVFATAAPSMLFDPASRSTGGQREVSDSISISDALEAVHQLKTFCKELNERLSKITGDTGDGKHVIDILEQIKKAVADKIRKASPMLAQILEEVKVAIEEKITEIKSSLQQGKGPGDVIKDLQDQLAKMAE